MLIYLYANAKQYSNIQHCFWHHDQRLYVKEGSSIWDITFLVGLGCFFYIKNEYIQFEGWTVKLSASTTKLEMQVKFVHCRVKHADMHYLFNVEDQANKIVELDLPPGWPLLHSRIIAKGTDSANTGFKIKFWVQKESIHYRNTK